MKFLVGDSNPLEMRARARLCVYLFMQLKVQSSCNISNKKLKRNFDEMLESLERIIE